MFEVKPVLLTTAEPEPMAVTSQGLWGLFKSASSWPIFSPLLKKSICQWIGSKVPVVSNLAEPTVGGKKATTSECVPSSWPRSVWLKLSDAVKVDVTFSQAHSFQECGSIE